MRRLGELSERPMALRFAAFLMAEGIPAQVREDDGGGTIWVINEDHMEAAEAHFAAFRASPEDERFKRGAAQSEKIAAEAEARRKMPAIKPKGGAVYTFGSMSAGKVTLALMLLCVIATLLAETGIGMGLTRLLYFSEYNLRSFPELRDGQVWRLVTPIFLHAGYIHLIFNVIWLFQLGGAIEITESGKRLLIMTLVLAVACNTAQYLVSGPSFVGASGVVYGLLGYIWLMSRHSAQHRYEMHPQTVYFMIGWMVVCLVGIIPNVANTQHVVGFVLGSAFGYLRSGALGTARRRKSFRNKP